MEIQDLLILMVVIWMFGKFFRAIKLPVLFGELLGGIIVGPAVLGWVNPDTEVIRVLAELGIFFLMLHAGLETNPREILASSKKSFIVGISGFIVPFIGGFLVSRAFGYDMTQSAFVAMGLSISAIAVAARILKDAKINKHKFSNIILAGAVIEDVMALIFFSVLLSIHQTGDPNIGDALIILGKVTAFFAVIMLAGFKFSKYLNRIIHKGNKGFTFTLILALLFGLMAEAIGLHIIIGAFLAGLFIREEVINKKVFEKIEDRIYGLSYSFLGPIFFASLAFHLDFSVIQSKPWFLITLIIVATAGKLIGCGIPARLVGFDKNKAAIVGIVMNSRGAVELALALVALKEGLIGPEIFSALILIAFVTTLMSIFGMIPFVKKIKNKSQS